jgi:hypothetical protein
MFDGASRRQGSRTRERVCAGKGRGRTQRESGRYWRLMSGPAITVISGERPICSLRD